MNTKYQADIVITETSTGWAIWMDDGVVANFNNRTALGYFAEGCGAFRKSVYDEMSGLFIYGSVDQLDR